MPRPQRRREPHCPERLRWLLQLLLLRTANWTLANGFGTFVVLLLLLVRASDLLLLLLEKEACHPRGARRPLFVAGCGCRSKRSDSEILLARKKFRHTICRCLFGLDSSFLEDTS